MATHERELTRPVDLCDGHGRLNDDARGWSRHPMLRANLRRAHGRKKKWDYWCVITDEVVVSFVYADVDYVGLANVWVMNHATGDQATAGVMVPFARRFSMPEQVCEGTVSHEQGRFALRITETPEHTEITARGTDPKAGDIEVDLRVLKPQGHESLNVLIPWSRRRFQFTSKQNSRPTVGTVRVGTRTYTVDSAHDAWGVQDLGRGIWPYSNRWNWAAASGHSTTGQVVGLQFGGRWTVGTGATENALCIDGRLTKIGRELEWDYDWADPMRPWRLTGDDGRIDLTLTPTFDRYDVTDVGVLKMEVHQCFGTWSGTVVDDDGTAHHLDGIRGFAEEARNRW
ncbi:MAG: hypothetical protein RLZ04_1472 [Actinomycetota bacterium]